jgi:hypothetical protein
MTTEPQPSDKYLLQNLAETRGTLAAIEERWKLKREESKRLTLQLITEHGYSVNRAAELSGHHRNTIMIWLKIHNAENKGSGSRA